MSAFLFQGNVDFALHKDTAVFRSGTAGVDIRVAQGRDAEEPGAQLLLTTGKTNSGHTAGEEKDVRTLPYDSFLFVCCLFVCLFFGLSVCPSLCLSVFFFCFLFVCFLFDLTVSLILFFVCMLACLFLFCCDFFYFCLFVCVCRFVCFFTCSLVCFLLLCWFVFFL